MAAYNHAVNKVLTKFNIVTGATLPFSAPVSLALLLLRFMVSTQHTFSLATVATVAITAIRRVCKGRLKKQNQLPFTLLNGKGGKWPGISLVHLDLPLSIIVFY